MTFNFRNTYSFIKSLASIIVLLFLGGVFLSIYFGNSSREKLKLCENLIENGAITDTSYDPKRSEERTLTIKGLDIISYHMVYTFKANGQNFEGSNTLFEIPKTLAAKVSYLPTDPTQNMVDPSLKLPELKKNAKSRFHLFAGIILLLWGLLTAKNLLSHIKKDKKAILIKRKEQKSDDGIIETPRSKLVARKQEATMTGELPPLKKEDSLKKPKVSNESSVIKKDELKKKSETTFKVTDHSRFMPPTNISKGEEE